MALEREYLESWREYIFDNDQPAVDGIKEFIGRDDLTSPEKKEILRYFAQTMQEVAEGDDQELKAKFAPLAGQLGSLKVDGFQEEIDAMANAPIVGVLSKQFFEVANEARSELIDKVLENDQLSPNVKSKILDSFSDVIDKKLSWLQSTKNRPMLEEKIKSAKNTVSIQETRANLRKVSSDLGEEEGQQRPVDKPDRNDLLREIQNFGGVGNLKRTQPNQPTQTNSNGALKVEQQPALAPAATQQPVPQGINNPELETTEAKQAESDRSLTFSSRYQSSGQVEPDDITRKIRDSVILEQKKIIVSDPSAAQLGIQGMSVTEYQNFLKDPENKAKVDAIASKPEVKKELEKVEIAGYKAVTQDMSTITWTPLEGPAPANTTLKTNEVKDEAGNTIATLEESTRTNQSHNVQASNGTVQIKSYRTVDIPSKIDEGTNMHLSLVLKDENGKSPSVNKAVYFTVHYEDGKLVEMSYPTPVKFTSEHPDALGYVEHGGKIYTLPVTQGKYNELRQELAQNLGEDLDVIQVTRTPPQAQTLQQPPVEPDGVTQPVQPPVAPQPVQPTLSTNSGGRGTGGGGEVGPTMKFKTPVQIDKKETLSEREKFNLEIQNKANSLRQKYESLGGIDKMIQENKAKNPKPPSEHEEFRKKIETKAAEKTEAFRQRALSNQSSDNIHPPTTPSVNAQQVKGTKPTDNKPFRNR